jgi:hypothetical protein
MYDIYSDISLDLDYYHIGYLNQSFNIDELRTCDGIYNCSEKIVAAPATNVTTNGNEMVQELPGIDPHRFKVAFWVTLLSTVVSCAFYVICIAFDSSPEIVVNVSGWISELVKDWCGNEKVAKIVGFTCRMIVTIPFILGWPFIHFCRRVKYQVSLKQSKYTELLTNSDHAWNNIKAVEYGLEASLQLFLQLWLLGRVFLPSIATWDCAKLAVTCSRGILNFVTFNLQPACYVEKALGKILITVISLSLGVAQMRNKPGLGLFDRPLKTLPMWMSVLAQIVARIYAIQSLILLSFGPLKYAVFFIFHYIIVLSVKVAVEVTCFKDMQARHGGDQPKVKCANLLSLVKFFISVMSSAVVIIRLHEDYPPGTIKSFIASHTIFFLLILFENMALVSLPYILPHRYPPLDCYTENRFTACCMVVGKKC